VLAHSVLPWVDPAAYGDVLHPKSDGDWDELVGLYAQPDTPFAAVLAVARESGCSSIVVEHRYIDLDFRSEHAAFWSLRFEVPPPFTRRLHFFTAEIDKDQLHDLSADAGYLGYSILRPVSRGRVGRTVLAPPPRLRDATLTLVEDKVSMFGNDLVVRGVPFCEQDGEYLRCAHAAAWICHYVAVRRELVGRTSTSSLVNLIPNALSEERALPSKGMRLNQLQAVFGALGQPALLYGFSSLPDVSGVVPATPTVDETTGKVEPPGLWDTRCISIICRYLNSDFPVLVAGQAHAWVLVGWKRAADGSVTFVACDDQVGPYEEIPSPFTHYRAPWHSIMVPLPPKVFLTGETAENDAFRTLRGLWSANDPTKPIAEALRKGTIQLRTRLKNVRTFKREIALQTSSEDVLRAIRLARLPHFVWVVEAHLRPHCHNGDCVVATVLYDATSSDHEPRQCVIAIPGAVAIYHPEGAPPEIIQGSYEPWRSMLSAH
jgi:hypothetical protein